MKFPVPGNHVPQTLGRDVWDPYVLQHGPERARRTYHLSQAQIYNGGYVIRTTIDDKKMAALYEAVRENEAQINASSHPFTQLHARGRGARGPRQRRDPGRVRRARLHRGEVQRDRQGHHRRSSARRSAASGTWRLTTASRSAPRSSRTSWPPRSRQGMNVQTSTLNGFNNLYIAPDSAPTDVLHDDPGAGGPTSCKTTRTSENGPYTPQIAMAVSINTAYADLWHRVGGTPSPTWRRSSAWTPTPPASPRVPGHLSRWSTRRASRSARRR